MVSIRLKHFTRAGIRLNRRLLGQIVAVLTLVFALHPVTAQDATDEAPPVLGNIPMLRADIPADFVPSYDAGQLSLSRPDDLMFIYIAAGDYARSWFPEAPGIDPATAIDAYSAFDMYSFDESLRTIETAGEREVVIQPFFHPAYGENVLLMTTLLDPETLVVVLALKADADLDDADRTLVLDLISSLETDPAAEAPAPPEQIEGDSLPEGEVQFTEGTTLTYGEGYRLFEGSQISKSATLWSDDDQTYVTVYVADNNQHLGERSGAEYAIEPSMQQSGLEDFQAETDGELVSDENGRTITRYVSSEWSPYGQPQVNFYYLVVEGEEHIAVFQGLTYDLVNLDAHVAAFGETAKSVVFGESE